MDATAKLNKLAQAAQYDLACACGPSQKRSRGKDGKWIYPAALPDGGVIPLLKVLQSGGCERKCAYCAQREGGTTGTASFSSDELAGLFDELVHTNTARGLFLSSAIRGSPIKTMDKMLATAELVRFKYRFRGFIHMKIIPGAEEDQIQRAMELANRISVNLEAPTKESLDSIAPGKDFAVQLQGVMRYVASLLKQERFRCRSQTTQFVVGAADDRDSEILKTLWDCYEEMNLARGYFSAFQPIPSTPLEGRDAASPMREHRLYQADFLIRKYAFSYEDFFFNETSNLSLSTDPKTTWAKYHPEIFPVEINTAPPPILLRVPGIGPQSTESIIRFRLHTCIKDLDTLRFLVPRWRISAKYLLLNGRAQAKSRQLSLF